MDASALSLFTNGIASLFLGSDKQHSVAVGSNVTDEHVSLFQLFDGFLQVDDVDAVALGEDVLGHLGVPSSGLVTEVHACFEKLFHGYYAH